jgi:hypothetical protein
MACIGAFYRQPIEIREGSKKSRLKVAEPAVFLDRSAARPGFSLTAARPGGQQAGDGFGATDSPPLSLACLFFHSHKTWHARYLANAACPCCDPSAASLETMGTRDMLRKNAICILRSFLICPFVVLHPVSATFSMAVRKKSDSSINYLRIFHAKATTFITLRQAE